MLIVRRVSGESMAPSLSPGQIVVGVRIPGFCRRFVLKPGSMVIVKHDGLEKIKRVAQLSADHRRVYVVGDNPDESTDSRHFGWLGVGMVSAGVVWPFASGGRQKSEG